MPYLIRTSNVLTLPLILLATSVLAQESKDAEMHFNRGGEYLQSNKYDEAISEFKQATSIKPEWAEAYFKLGLAYSLTPITAQDKTAHQKAALVAFKEAVRFKPDWAEAHNELGKKYREFNQYDEAVKSLKEAIRLGPDFAEAHENLGIAYLYKGQHAEGIVSLKEAVRLKPDRASAHKLLGLAYLALDDRQKAVEQYNLLKSLDFEVANYLYSAIQRPEKFTFGVTNGKPLSTPKPEYPDAARKAHVSGKVTVEVVIDEQGKVISAHALNGPSELQKAAETAALKATFSPTKLSGTPVKVKGVITYDFSRY